MDIGSRLYSTFVSAGLPAPKLSCEMLVDSNPASDIYKYSTDTLRRRIPQMDRLGIATAEATQVETLADRLHQEAAAVDRAVGLRPLMGSGAVSRDGLDRLESKCPAWVCVSSVLGTPAGSRLGTSS
jgi:hypothetical protein